MPMPNTPARWRPAIALSLVCEREHGALEQLTMTPVAPLGLTLGKMIPYGVMAFVRQAEN